jgi:tetratricopeptide (TPR) repeat protein
MIYSEAGISDKAAEYYQQALSLDHENPELLNQLAYFLIDKDLDVNRGLELADKALKSDPENYIFLDIKGWGLFKQGKYQEALDLIGKSDSLKLLWNYDIEVHLETIKKALARLNGN